MLDPASQTPRFLLLLQERKGCYYKYNGNPDSNILCPPTNSLAYQDDTERFYRDFAAEEYGRRLEKKYKDELANKEKKNFMSFDQDPDELERFNRAASKIQLLWRGYKAQAAQAASKPKGKGKKGKKK